MMKAADPTIKIGVVVVPGEDSYSNNATHFAINPRTGKTHYGWTPVMLTTLKTGRHAGFRSFIIFIPNTPTNGPHRPDSDPLSLQAAVNWASDAADLRQQLTDYLGPTGANVELVCTENNSDSGAAGPAVDQHRQRALSRRQHLPAHENRVQRLSLVGPAKRTRTTTAASIPPSMAGAPYGDEGVIIGNGALRHVVTPSFTPKN